MDARADLLRQISSRLVSICTGSMFWCSHAKNIVYSYTAKFSQVILRDIVTCWVHCRTRARLDELTLQRRLNWCIDAEYGVGVFSGQIWRSSPCLSHGLHSNSPKLHMITTIMMPDSCAVGPCRNLYHTSHKQILATLPTMRISYLVHSS